MHTCVPGTKCNLGKIGKSQLLQLTLFWVSNIKSLLQSCMFKFLVWQIEHLNIQNLIKI